MSLLRASNKKFKQTLIDITHDRTSPSWPTA